MKTLLLSIGTLFAQDPSPSDPVSDHLRFEIAVAERDYLDARLSLEHAQSQLALKNAEAQRACATQEKVWQVESFSCRPPEKKP